MPLDNLMGCDTVGTRIGQRRKSIGLKNLHVVESREGFSIYLIIGAKAF